MLQSLILVCINLACLSVLTVVLTLFVYTCTFFLHILIEQMTGNHHMDRYREWRKKVSAETAHRQALEERVARTDIVSEWSQRAPGAAWAVQGVHDPELQRAMEESQLDADMRSNMESANRYSCGTRPRSETDAPPPPSQTNGVHATLDGVRQSLDDIRRHNERKTIEDEMLARVLKESEEYVVVAAVEKLEKLEKDKEDAWERMVQRNIAATKKELEEKMR